MSNATTAQSVVIDAIVWYCPSIVDTLLSPQAICADPSTPYTAFEIRCVDFAAPVLVFRAADSSVGCAEVPMMFTNGLFFIVPPHSPVQPAACGSGQCHLCYNLSSGINALGMLACTGSSDYRPVPLVFRMMSVAISTRFTRVLHATMLGIGELIKGRLTRCQTFTLVPGFTLTLGSCEPPTHRSTGYLPSLPHGAPGLTRLLLNLVLSFRLMDVLPTCS